MNNENEQTKNNTSTTKKSKIIKGVIISLVVVIILVLATPFFSPKMRLLYSGTWANESGVLTFKPLFSFSYVNSGSGNPVANSDIRPFYIFLGDRYFMTLGIGKEVGKIITINDRELLLHFNGSTMMFANKEHEDYDDDSSFFSLHEDFKCETRCDKCNAPLYDADMCGYSTSVKNSSVSICPWKVSGDKERKEYSSTYKIVSSAKCTYITYSSELTTTDEIHSHTCKVANISKEKALSLLKDSSCQVFVNFTSSGKIKKLIILEGASTIVDDYK